MVRQVRTGQILADLPRQEDQQEDNVTPEKKFSKHALNIELELRQCQHVLNMEPRRTPIFISTPSINKHEYHGAS